MPTPSPTTLKCPGCDYVNEAERVYCHSCGGKLDRSVLPLEDTKAAQESADRTRKRVKKMTNPTSGGMLREVKAGATVLIWSAITAMVVQGVRPPRNLPSSKPKIDDASRIISSEISEALESPRPQQLVFSQMDVNLHLRSAKAKMGTSDIPWVNFERVAVSFEPKTCRIWLEQSMFGYSFYNGISYAVENVDGKVVYRLLGGSFGRLPIHPALMKYGGFIFSRAQVALKREGEQFTRMQSVVIEKERVLLLTKGGR